MFVIAHCVNICIPYLSAWTDTLVCRTTLQNSNVVFEVHFVLFQCLMSILMLWHACFISVLPSVRKPAVTTESAQEEPFFTIVCTTAEIEPTTTRYYVQWQVGNQIIDVDQPLPGTGVSILTAEDIEGLQLGDQVTFIPDWARLLYTLQE